MNTLIVIFCCIPLIIFIIFTLILAYQFYKLKAKTGNNISDFLADISGQIERNNKPKSRPTSKKTKPDSNLKTSEFEDAEFRRG